MDFYSLGFLFMIVMVSGVIAYLADIYGKKLGKKRLSIFGLRPRHTAALSTVTLGMMLSVLTISLITLFSAPVRKWLVEGTKAQQQLNQLKQDLNLEVVKVAEIQRQGREYQREASRYQDEISNKRKTLEVQGRQISSQQSNLKTLRLTQTSLENDLRSTRAEIASKDRLIRIDQEKIQATKVALQKIKASLAQIKGQLTLSEKVGHKVYVANSQLKADNHKLSSDIWGKKAELLAMVDQKRNLESSVALLNADLESNRRQLDSLKSELANETGKLYELRHERDDFLRPNVQISRTQPLTFGRFQEVCRLPVPANLSKEDADRAIQTLLDKAEEIAQKRGAKATEGYKAADIFDHQDTPSSKIKDLLSERLVGKPTEGVLIAVASINSFVDEPVPLDIAVKSNPMVYRKGETVVESELDGGVSERAIVRQLAAFGEAVRKKAQGDNMMPQGDGESFGSLPADEVLTLVHGVKQGGRHVRLQAIALSDIHAADPLRLDFRIR